MMLIGRSKPKTNLDMVRKIKGTLEKALSLPDSATISITELACFEEGCPPVETVVALLQAGSSPLQHKFHKPAGEFKSADLVELSVRWGFPVEADLFNNFDKEK